MVDIMTPLIAEADSVPLDLVEIVLGQILEPQKVSCGLLLLVVVQTVLVNFIRSFLEFNVVVTSLM